MSHAAPAPHPHARPANAPCALVIDDEPAVRSLVAAALRADGWRVLEAPDGESSFDLARLGKPDLILLDLALPGMSGLEVCRRLRQEPASARTPILFLTGLPGPAARQALSQAGGQGLLEKPFSLESLARRAAQAIGKPSYPLLRP